MPPRMDFWTDERIETLRTLWGQGLSCTQIAAQMGGASRNAIIGKVHRLKLTRTNGHEGRLKTGIKATPTKVIRKAKRWAANPSLAFRAQRIEERKQTRAQFIQAGTSKTSPAYRKHLPRIGEMSKSELRSMLSTAVQNTADLGDTV